MPKLKWRGSYETLKFNTVDGDLHKDQYAIETSFLTLPDGTQESIDTIYVRKHPENNTQFVVLDPDNLTSPSEKQALLSTMTKVEIVPGERAYYDEFVLPSGRIYRVASAKKDYKDLAKVGAKAKEKTLTNPH